MIIILIYLNCILNISLILFRKSLTLKRSHSEIFDSKRLSFKYKIQINFYIRSVQKFVPDLYR